MGVVAVASAGEVYWKRRVRRAFDDTIRPLGLNRVTAIAAVEAAAITLIAIWMLSGRDAMRAELNVIVATAIGFGVVFLGNYTWNYAATPSRMQREADQQLQQLQGTLDKVSNKQDAVDRLSDLLDEAIHSIWNRDIDTDAEVIALEADWKDWRERVIKELEANFTYSDVIHFSRLGVVPIRDRVGVFDEEHRRILRLYALEEERLREIIRDHNITRLT